MLIEVPESAPAEADRAWFCDRRFVAAVANAIGHAVSEVHIDAVLRAACEISQDYQLEHTAMAAAIERGMQQAESQRPRKDCEKEAAIAATRRAVSATHTVSELIEALQEFPQGAIVQAVVDSLPYAFSVTYCPAYGVSPHTCNEVYLVVGTAYNKTPE
jgi:hypothetical protein